MELAHRLGSVDCHGLISGEPGIGKQALARYVHEIGPRASQPLVVAMCEGATEDALEHLLFGDQGDCQYRGGLIGVANGGSLLLDEIAELPARLQARLMAALVVTGSVHGLNSPPPVRLLATTRHDLEALAAKGTFRRDLLSLLCCEINIPPIRKRRGDAEVVFRACCEYLGTSRELPSSVIEIIRSHDWPGNARQIEAMAARFVFVGSASSCDLVVPQGEEAPASPVQAEPPEFVPMRSVADLPGIRGGTVWQYVRTVGLHAFLGEVEDVLIARALEVSRGQRKAAADLLGMKRTTLVEKLRRDNEHKRSDAPLRPPSAGAPAQQASDPERNCDALEVRTGRPPAAE